MDTGFKLEDGKTKDETIALMAKAMENFALPTK
jgi:hypothetical protein